MIDLSRNYILATVAQYALIMAGVVLINVGVHKHKYWVAVGGGLCLQISGMIGGMK